QQFTQLGARAAHAGQVRGGVEAVVGVQAFHRLRRVRKRGTARAEGAGNVIGVVRLEFRRGLVQLRALFVGLRWIDLEADRGAGDTAGHLRDFRQSIASSR